MAHAESERGLQIQLSTALREAERLEGTLASAFVDLRESEKRADAAESERDALRAALDGLVKRLDFVHADGAYQSVWTLHQLHMGPYHGPRYVDELDAARAALASGGDRG